MGGRTTGPSRVGAGLRPKGIARPRTPEEEEEGRDREGEREREQRTPCAWARLSSLRAFCDSLIPSSKRRRRRERERARDREIHVHEVM